MRGIPARLADYVEIRAAAGGDAHDVMVRRVRLGDPPDGSVVAPDVDTYQTPLGEIRFSPEGEVIQRDFSVARVSMNPDGRSGRFVLLP